VSGGGRAEQEGEAARPEEEEAEGCQEDLFEISKEFREPSVN
jgi:hypothetical protein